MIDTYVDDGPKISKLITEARYTRCVSLPPGELRISEPIRVPYPEFQIYGCGIGVTTIRPMQEVQLPDFFELEASKTRLRLGAMELDGCHRTQGLSLAKLDRMSWFSDLLVRRCKVGWDIVDEAYLLDIGEVEIAGCDIGFQCLDSVMLSASKLTGLRLKNNGAGMILHNPRPKAVIGMRFDKLVLEQNKGVGLVLLGGHNILMNGQHIEANGRVTGEPDVVMGAFPGSTADCRLHMSGVTWSTAGEAQRNQGSPRVRFAGHYAQLTMDKCQITPSSKIEVGKYRIGSAIAGRWTTRPTIDDDSVVQDWTTL